MRVCERLAFAWLFFWLGSSSICWTLFDAQYLLSRSAHGASGIHILGFDIFGRDLFLTTLSSSFVSISLATLTAVSGLFISLLIGIALTLNTQRLGYWGLRVLDFSLAFPSILIALSLAAMRGPGWITLIISLWVAIIPSLTRLAYLRASELQKQDYVQAAVSLGASPWHLAARHIFPETLRFCAVKFPGLFAGAILAETALSFLGVGAPGGSDTWGTMLSQSKDYLLEGPHIAVGVGVPLFLTILSLQVFSERRLESSSL